MNIKEKVIGSFKCLVTQTRGFLTKEIGAGSKTLEAINLADIFIALAPVLIFGCLIFGLRALLVSVISAAIFLGFDCLWDIIFKRDKKGLKDINFSAMLSGLMLGLVLSSRLHIFLLIAASLLGAFLQKTLFKNRLMYITAPALVVRGVAAIVFFKAFSVYALPFVGSNTQSVPLDIVFKTGANTYPAKYLFFGLHSGNIGETSVFLIIVGGIYLMLRRIINPVIPVGFIATSAVLSLIFGENIAVSLLGGGLFFAAMYMTLGYSLKTAPRYKKILYGLFCGILTFVIRRVLKTESAYLAVLITETVLSLVTRRNIKRGLKFVKNPDFKRLLKKLGKTFRV